MQKSFGRKAYPQALRGESIVGGRRITQIPENPLITLKVNMYKHRWGVSTEIKVGVMANSDQTKTIGMKYIIEILTINLILIEWEGLLVLIQWNGTTRVEAKTLIKVGCPESQFTTTWGVP